MEYIIQNFDFISSLFANAPALIFLLGIFGFGGGGDDEAESDSAEAAEAARQAELASAGSQIERNAGEYAPTIRLREQCYLLKYCNVFNQWSQSHNWQQFQPLTGNQ